MVSIAETGAELFAALGGQRASHEALANAALARGTTRFADHDLDGAVQDFQRAIAFDPTRAEQAYGLIAQTHLARGDSDAAIAAYRRAATAAPLSAAPRVELGKIYFSLGRYPESRREYEAALRLEPRNPATVLSVGHAALATGDAEAARRHFSQVVATNPRDHGGFHALGQALAELGRSNEAIAAFESALELKHDFHTARVDLGIAYADRGDWVEANFQLRVLEERAPSLATVLDTHLTTVAAPRILAGYSDGGFSPSAAAGTEVSTFDAALESPNGTQSFEMKFLFDKAMDASSVQDISKWSIQRAPPSSPGGGYNWGQPVPATEVTVAPLPVSVIYDADSLTATVVFQVQQNADATGTLDPQHLVFRFRGTDAYANAMDESADEFSGMSLVA